VASSTRTGVVAEQLLHLAALFALDAAVDHDHGLFAADQAANLDGQVVQRVAVLGEDDQLALTAVGVVHLGRVCSSGELVPLAVLAGVDDLPGLLFQPFEDDDLGLELLNGLGGGGLVDTGFLEVLVVLGDSRRRFPDVVGLAIDRLRPAIAALAQLFFLDAALQLVAAALERLVDGLGLEARRRCSAVRAKPTVPLRPPGQLVGAVQLLFT
jgi:hypothetical protein